MPLDNTGANFEHVSITTLEVSSDPIVQPLSRPLHWTPYLAYPMPHPYGSIGERRPAHLLSINTEAAGHIRREQEQQHSQLEAAGRAQRLRPQPPRRRDTRAFVIPAPAAPQSQIRTPSPAPIDSTEPRVNIPNTWSFLWAGRDPPHFDVTVEEQNQRMECSKTPPNHSQVAVATDHGLREFDVPRVANGHSGDVTATLPWLRNFLNPPVVNLAPMSAEHDRLRRMAILRDEIALRRANEAAERARMVRLQPEATQKREREGDMVQGRGRLPDKKAHGATSQENRWKEESRVQEVVEQPTTRTEVVHGARDIGRAPLQMSPRHEAVQISMQIKKLEQRLEQVRRL
jgi:hypothetical protein